MSILTPANPPVMTIESPCIKICVVDPATRTCTGCGRSLDQIARWGSMTSAERRRVMNELSARRTAAPGS